MNPYPPAQDPTGPTPSNPGAAYFDPITGQQVYLDPTSGGFTGAPAAEPPPAYPPTYPAPGYPPAAPTYPGYPPVESYPGAPPAYPAPAGYPGTPGYPAAPGYPPNPYGGQTGYPGGFYYPTATGKTNGLAVGSLVTAIVGLLTAWCFGVGGLIGAAGAVMGHISMGQIQQSNESGRGMALAGVIIGWIAVVLGVLFAILDFSSI
jgi:hypothetical protein